MRRSTERIITTHCGSMPRPADLLDMMRAKLSGEPYDRDAYARRIHSAVAESVRRQIECGIDVPTDGEQGKSSFFAYHQCLMIHLYESLCVSSFSSLIIHHLVIQYYIRNNSKYLSLLYLPFFLSAYTILPDYVYLDWHLYNAENFLYHPCYLVLVLLHMFY